MPAMPSLLSPGNPDANRPYTPLSDHINSSGSSPSAAFADAQNGNVVYSQQIRDRGGDIIASSSKGGPRIVEEGGGDIGDIQRGPRPANGKGKEKEWDPEQGRMDIESVQSSDSSYPPVNEEDDEERKIQEVSPLISPLIPESRSVCCQRYGSAARCSHIASTSSITSYWLGYIIHYILYAETILPAQHNLQ
jgi:hypothetical protein